MAGVIAGFLRFIERIKPGFLDVKVFAIYSVYFDTKYFSFIGNNISEEIVGLLLFTGLFLLSFSREKQEFAGLWVVRVQAFIKAFYINAILIVLAFIFVYGLGFVFILILNLFSFFIFYYPLFRWYLHCKLKTSRSR